MSHQASVPVLVAVVVLVAVASSPVLALSKHAGCWLKQEVSPKRRQKEPFPAATGFCQGRRRPRGSEESSGSRCRPGSHGLAAAASLPHSAWQVPTGAPGGREICPQPKWGDRNQEPGFPLLGNWAAVRSRQSLLWLDTHPLPSLLWGFLTRLTSGHVT